MAVPFQRIAHPWPSVNIRLIAVNMFRFWKDVEHFHVTNFRYSSVFEGGKDAGKIRVIKVKFVLKTATGPCWFSQGAVAF